MRLGILKLMAFMVGHLPRSMLLAIGRFVGLLAFKLDKKRRGIAVDNIKRAFDRSMTDEVARDTAKGAFKNLGMTALEFVKLPWLKRDDLNGYVELAGKENLDRALKKGRGTIILTAHFGNWELMGVALALYGYPMDVVVRSSDSPVFEAFITWIRTQCGNIVVPKHRSMRRLLTTLKNNGSAGILIDQNVAHVEGVFVDFFGIPACTNRGPAVLALASKATVLPTFMVREGACHRIIVGKEVELRDTGDKEGDALANTARMTAIVEDIIRKYPEQWFWVHRRWKTRPQKTEG